MTRRRLAGPVVAALIIGATMVALDKLLPPDVSRLDQLSRVVTDRDGARLRAYLSADGYQRLPARLDAVDPHYVEMLVAYEDKRYWSHPGVDPLALARAGWQALIHGQIVSGASTLTMQTARLLEPRPRTGLSKLIEMARALQLERRFTKREILEFYLTLAPLGGNLEGVEAGAWHFFGHGPARLTAAEAALLVALPQSPARLRPDRHPKAARDARDKVLDRVAEAGVLSADLRDHALAEPVLSGPPRPPTAAPHLADRLLGAHGQARAVRSSIDGVLQRRWETIVARRARELGPAVSIAVLAVDNRTRAARAYIGSADFADPVRAGQVDVVRALRSPGSALKPIIYALAFDRGLAHPATLVDDVPTRFGDYAPANFMDRHYGRVSLTSALRTSLNVPAVALLDRLGPVAVVARLRRAGVRLDFGDPAAAPGLAFALGGVGTTLEDLVGLYAALADDGRFRPVRLTAEDPVPDDSAPLFGDAARWYVGEILRGARPPGLLPDRFRRLSRPLAFKTGTSYGFRDAWAIGYDADYTVGVWIGRPDGTPNPGRFGANTAAPLLFQLFDDLPPSGRARPARPRHALALNAKLPPGLRHLGRDFTDAQVGAAGPPPRIVYPIDGTRLNLPAGALPLEAEGGHRPLTWLVNGAPLAANGQRRRAQWRPDGVGFSDIVVIDAHGRQATARVRIASE